MLALDSLFDAQDFEDTVQTEIATLALADSSVLAALNAGTVGTGTEAPGGMGGGAAGAGIAVTGAGAKKRSSKPGKGLKSASTTGDGSEHSVKKSTKLASTGVTTAVPASIVPGAATPQVGADSSAHSTVPTAEAESETGTVAVRTSAV
jgi:hypothetical protein